MNLFLFSPGESGDRGVASYLPDMAYCWNHVRITCELGSIPTVGIGGQVAWFPNFYLRDVAYCRNHAN